MRFARGIIGLTARSLRADERGRSMSSGRTAERLAGRDGPTPPKGRTPDPRRRPVHQGHRQLLAWTVPLLRRGGTAANQQRLGTTVRLPPPSSTPGHRPPRRLTHARRARTGPTARRHRDPNRSARPGRCPAQIPPPLAPRAPGTATTHRQTLPSYPLQTQPRRLFDATRRTPQPASFAGVVFLSQIVSWRRCG